ncbi:MAG: hypothetical protein KIT80_11945 [Chitinophagaceae bacterium]|nr:hypothetical protein [Chitinophagaceae bacterium]MCW5927614.1 hypothetical protein [Chitinophagaceae bacterium]
MINTGTYFLFFLTCLALPFHLTAQDEVNTDPCRIADIQKQADSIKQYYTREGFTVLREASISMESEYELPILMPMKQGEPYEIVFIGDSRSNICEVKMYDYKERQVVYQRKKDGEPYQNIIQYGYKPQMSEYHMIKPVQVNEFQKKNLCGYIIFLRKTGPSLTKAIL